MLRLKKKVSSRRRADHNNGGGSGILLIESKYTSSSRVIFVDDENMVVEILSRLPVKSLLRFKCVSKRWCSLIQDPYFVDLHSARSITRPGATFFISSDLRGRNVTFFGSTLYDGPHFYAVDYDSFIGDPARNFDTFGPHFFLERYYDFIFFEKLRHIQILNGLLFMSFKEETVWIINPSIRKTILLTKSNIREEESFKNKDVIYDGQYNLMHSEYVIEPKYGFGFDPVTKKYKVICICKVSMYYVPPQYFLYNPLEGIEHEFNPLLLKFYYRCKVLTIEEDGDCCCWRSTDEIPPRGLAGDPVYLNHGALYWRNEVSYDQNEDFEDQADVYPNMEVQVIVAFDISSEKFSVIEIPDFVCRPGHHHGYKQELYEVDGHLAILDNNSTTELPNTIAIWKFVVAPHEAAAKSSADDCCWVKETILTLSFDWRKEGYLFEVIWGTNQILLKRSRPSTSFCYYNRRDNYLVDDHGNNSNSTCDGEKQLEFTGKAASFTGIQLRGVNYRTFYTCTESLWSLNSSSSN